jgi:phospholipid-transporting ATPase
MIITLIPGVSPVFPITSILPVIFILSLTMIKDGLEDFVRFLDDYKVNNVRYQVIRKGKMITIPSKSIELGDFVIVQRNCEIPADLLLLTCSNPEGISFVETANLDGETNLKPRKCLLDSKDLKNPEDFLKLKSVLTVEPPNEYLNNFQGQYIHSEENPDKIIPLNSDNLLLRGCVLRNTKIAYGIATYVGINSKMFKNLKKPRSKFSSLDKKLNFVLFFLLVAQQLGCIFSVVFSCYFQNNLTLNSFYVVRYNPNQVDYSYVASDWLTYFVLYNLVIPMSLFVGLEFVKSFQAKIMEFDPHLMEDNIGMKAKTSNLNEELSQLDFIFSDKTGTLTENVMEFKKAYVHGIEYDKTIKPNLLEEIAKTSTSKELVQHVHLFLLNLATNHAVIPEFVDDKIAYDGPSPDEIALLDCAQLNGYVLTQKTNAGVEVNILGYKTFFEILTVIDFTSARKMMTIVIRTDDNKIILFSKGADNVMSERLSVEGEKETSQLLDCQEKLYNYSVEGLRTLIIGYKELTEEYFEEWNKRYKVASSSLKNRGKLMEEIEKELEKDYKLLGCTAIEDKLQNGVPQAIEYLIKMKLQVWVLTGDKTETAINISQCANVIDRDSTLKLMITGDTREKVEYELMCVLQFLKNEKKSKEKKTKRYAVVVSGKSLEYILDSKSPPFYSKILCCDVNQTKLQKIFTEISSYCYSAVCSRLLPIQKALLVKLILRYHKKKGLSIGDGANDVSMIQSASVGVGIMGREGSQASRAADYAIPKFKHLVRLVAIHGRYSYVRNSDYLHISFYKNLLVVFGQFFFSCFCAFTGQTFYDSWTITFYNTFFTTFFPFIPAVFEKDLKEKVIFENPQIYKTVANEKLFNLWTVFLTIMTSLYHSTAIFFIIYGVDYTSGGMLENSKNDGIWTVGAVNMTATFIVINLRVILETRSISFIHYSLHFTSILVYFIFHYFYSCFSIITIYGAENGYFFYEFFVILKSLKCWMIIILCCVVAMLPDLVFKFVRKRFFPDAASALRIKHSESKKNQWFNFSCDYNVEESKEMF